MNEELRAYLQKEFSGEPDTPENRALFEEILGNLSDRCAELIASGYDRRSAMKTAMDEMGDISPLIERGDSHVAWEGSAERKKDSTLKKERTTRYCSAEELRRRKIKRGAGIAVAVALFILSVVPALFGSLLALALFPIVGAGVALIIFSAQAMAGYVDNSAVLYSPERLQRDRNSANLILAIGIFCCVVSVVPPAAFSQDFGVALFFLLVAIGVGCIVFSALFRPKAKSDVKIPPAFPSDGGGEKKHQKKIGKVIFGIAIALSLALFVLLMVLDIKGYDLEIGIVSLTNVDLQNNGNGSVADPVSRLSVEWSGGSVSVLPAPEGMENISVVATAKGGGELPENDTVYWGMKNGRLLIRDRKNIFSGIRFLKKYEKCLTIYVPAEKSTFTRVDIEVASADLTIEEIVVRDVLDICAASGNVTLNSVLAEKGGDAPVGYSEKISVDIASGNIVLRGVSAAEVDLDLASGDAFAEDSRCEYLKISTASGNVTYSGKVDVAKISTASGNVKIIPESDCRELKFDTASGDVTVIVDGMEGGFTLEMDTASGKVHSAVACTLQNGRYIFGDGATGIEADTASGDVYLETATAGQMP